MTRTDAPPSYSWLNEGVSPATVAGRAVAIVMFAVTSLAYGIASDLTIPGSTHLVLMVCALASLALIDKRALRQVSVPPLLIVLWLWMLLSVVWTQDPAGTRFGLLHDVPLAIALALTVGVSRLATTFSTLLWVVRFAIVTSLAATIFIPGTRELVDPTEIVPGWRGFFAHKNFIGQFLPFAVVTALCFDRRRSTK